MHIKLDDFLEEGDVTEVKKLIVRHFVELKSIFIVQAC